ncbi:MAG: TonB-dependent receptor, partial [Candidatus Eremiobacteraeota bacterium]|nr:TonB-dependent receptor [Candidatus Eremiobacteraeota bacterium]
MHAALTAGARAIACVAFALLTLVPIRGLSAEASPSPGASPSPTPKPAATYENYLGKIIAHASTREGYTIPIAELERLGARTVGDVLQFVPGAFLRQTGTDGSLQTIQLRGNGAAQTLVLLDGRPVNEADTGVTDLTSMPLDGVKAISVVEGGLSSRYGSGAIGGVVNITTKRPNSIPRESAYGQVGYEGAYGAGAGFTVGGAQDGLRVDAFTRYAENTFDYPGYEGVAAGTRTNNDARVWDVTMCACFEFGDKRQWNADLHIDDNTSQIGAPGSAAFGPEFVSTLARQQRDVLRNTLNLGYGTTNSATTAILYVDGRRLHFYDPTPPFPFDDETTATQRGFSIEERIETGYRNTIAAKYEQNGAVADFAPLIARSSTTDLYVGDTYTWKGRPEIDAAVQFAHTQGSPATTLPSFAISEQVGGEQGADGTAVRASYARAFRAPNLDELYFPGFGNPSLQPEYATTFDVGARTYNREVDAFATLFGSDTNNLIVNQEIDTMGDFLPFNVGKARVRGYDLQISNANNSRVGWQLAYSAYPVAEDLSSAPDINGVTTTGNRLLYRPTYTAGLELWRRAGHDPTPKTEVGEDGLDLLVIGRQYADEENIHLLPPYATVGFHVMRNLDEHLSLLLRVNNLMGARV